MADFFLQLDGWHYTNGLSQGSEVPLFITHAAGHLSSLPINKTNTESMVWYWIYSFWGRPFEKNRGDLIATQVRNPSSIGFSIRCRLEMLVFLCMDQWTFLKVVVEYFDRHLSKLIDILTHPKSRDMDLLFAHIPNITNGSRGQWFIPSLCCLKNVTMLNNINQYYSWLMVKVFIF